ncbi:DNA-processing protein DprA [Kamptonema cortianum]|nr:DNA-processing protein DprA [Kamptonema cortianum]
MNRILTRNDLLSRSADDFIKLGAESLREEYRMKQTAAARWVGDREKWLKEAEEVEQVLEPKGVRVVTATDANYPRQLETFDPDPPGILYVYGNQKLLGADLFCVLASRGASDEVLAEIEKRTEEGVLAGKVLVSGHDTPEYQRSAVTCLRWGAPRIMVLDTGFFAALGEDLKDEPFASARLWRFEFDERTDLAISAVHPLRTYHRNSNRIRDRIIGGLSFRIDCVWAQPGGNMEKMARMGLRSGRQVTVSSISPTYESLCSAGAEPIAQIAR